MTAERAQDEFWPVLRADNKGPGGYLDRSTVDSKLRETPGDAEHRMEPLDPATRPRRRPRSWRPDILQSRYEPGIRLLSPGQDGGSGHRLEGPALAPQRGEPAMPFPRPRVPIRFESVEKMVNGQDLRSLIVPVEEGLRKFDQLYENMMSSLSGSFLILRGDTGSGKTTLLHTLGLFVKGVQTVPIRRDELIRETLESLGPCEGRFRVVVIENREALSDTSDVEIESIILAINRFTRSRAGERTVVAWPCNSDPIAEKLAASAGPIGGEALLGVEEAVFRYHGPPRGEYLRIARRTIAAFNSGASLADLGISEERAEQLAREAETIGKFLNLLQVEERKNREILAGKLPNQEQCRMWVVVAAKNDPEAEVGVLTRGQY